MNDVKCRDCRRWLWQEPPPESLLVACFGNPGPRVKPDYSCGEGVPIERPVVDEVNHD